MGLYFKISSNKLEMEKKNIFYVFVTKLNCNILESEILIENVMIYNFVEDVKAAKLVYKNFMIDLKRKYLNANQVFSDFSLGVSIC